MSKQRIVYLDVLRVLACCMIVLMHSPHPDAGIPGYFLTPIGFLTGTGIGLFFMVSGALLLPVQTDTSYFLKRRLGKIIFPLLFWTLFYLAVSWILGERDTIKILHSIASIPFSAQGHGVLWFMYTLTGLYLLAPIISPMLQKSNRKEIRFYLILWAVTLCYPWLAKVVDVNRGTTGILYYFTGYAGYFVLGYYMHTYCPKIRGWLIPLLFILPYIALALYYYYGKQGDFYDLFWYESIMLVMMCVGIFYVIRYLSERYLNIGGVITVLSNCSFGVYLMHIFIMQRVIWHSDFIVCHIGGLGQWFITWVLTLVLSFALTWAISYLPFAEYIIGYKHKRK